MKKLKEKVLMKLNEDLDTSYKETYRSFEDARESRDNDTKSSAGDKYETGRAMMQREMDNAEMRLSQIQALKNELNRLPTKEESDKVIPGTLVKTTGGIYFIGVSLGKMEIENQLIYAISTASPLGKLLHLKKENDTVIFNGQKQGIEWIV